MSLLLAVASSLGYSGSAITLSAVWDNLSVTSPDTDSSNVVTLTFTGGGSRDIRLDYTILGSVSYKKNGGTTTEYSGPISVVTTDTLQFIYTHTIPGEPESRPVRVYDDTRGGLIDTFTVTAS